MLKLVEELTTEAQEHLVKEMKLQWLRRSIDEADESLARGDSLSLEELDAHLDDIRKQKLRNEIDAAYYSRQSPDLKDDSDSWSHVTTEAAKRTFKDD